MIEILIVAAITVLIVGVVAINLSQSHTGGDLTNATKQIAALLREAQARSITQASGTTWGVHFDNIGTAAFYALFYGSSYSSGASANYVRLPADLCYSTPAQGTSTNVIFSQISGLLSATTSIKLQTSNGCTSGGTATASSTITVNGAGLVSYYLPHYLCPRQESNLHHLLRREIFYPLNYGDNTPPRRRALSVL